MTILTRRRRAVRPPDVEGDEASRWIFSSTAASDRQPLPVGATTVSAIVMVAALVVITVLVTLGRWWGTSFSFAAPSYQRPDLSRETLAPAAPTDGRSGGSVDHRRTTTRAAAAPGPHKAAERWLHDTGTPLAAAAASLSTQTVSDVRAWRPAAVAEDCAAMSKLSDEARRSPPPQDETAARDAWSQAIASASAAAAHCAEAVATRSTALLEHAAAEARQAGQNADEAVATVRGGG
jgi:hypothetical protein